VRVLGGGLPREHQRGIELGGRVCEQPLNRLLTGGASAGGAGRHQRFLEGAPADAQPHCRDQHAKARHDGDRGPRVYGLRLLQRQVRAHERPQTGGVDGLHRDARSVQRHGEGRELVTVARADNRQAAVHDRRHPRRASAQRTSFRHRHVLGRQGKRPALFATEQQIPEPFDGRGRAGSHRVHRDRHRGGRRPVRHRFDGGSNRHQVGAPIEQAHSRGAHDGIGRRGVNAQVAPETLAL
jgi:hypothetical protein